MPNKAFIWEGDVVTIFDETGKERKIKADAMPLKNLQEYLSDYTDITPKEKSLEVTKPASKDKEVEQIKQDVKDSTKFQEFQENIKGKSSEQIQPRIESNKPSNKVEDLNKEKQAIENRLNLQDPTKPIMTVHERDQLQKRLIEIDNIIRKLGE